MKESNTNAWNKIDKVWSEKMQDRVEEVPAGLWDQIETRLDERAIRPFWTRVRMSPWTWSAAAILVILLGLNWNPNTTEGEVKLATEAAFQKPIEGPAKMTYSTESVKMQKINNPIAHLAISTVTIEKAPNIETPVIETAQEPIAATAPKQDESEEIWVRVDIDPVVENTKPVAYQELNQPKPRQRGFGRFIKQLKQVIKGEEPDWQEIQAGKPALVDGIHQVANTYYRTEQTVKQTFQIQ